jgi:hypothetical protein
MVEDGGRCFHPQVLGRYGDRYLTPMNKVEAPEGPAG